MKNKRKLFLPLVLVLIIIGISYVTYYGGIEKRKKVQDFSIFTNRTYFPDAFLAIFSAGRAYNIQISHTK